MICGWFSTSKKSGERRCASRWGSRVSTLATSTVPYALTPSGVTSSVPSNSLNWPLTVAMPRCLTWNSMLEWTGSIFHVPVGSGVCVAVLSGVDIGSPRVAGGWCLN